MINRAYIRKLEDGFCAPYAMKSYLTRGRVYAEVEHAYRSAYQRDRDRIIHSAAFRRLEYKTQVFVNHEGDYYRTRLTHTLEASQIARTLAFALRLNIDLTEAVALAHDLGHTPFGHSGEDTLNALMREEGGFNHNVQGLRVVDELEERYPDFPGLNLTYEVREGIIKHSSAFDVAGTHPEFQKDRSPTLETQIVDAADEIAYDNHDIDDGLTSGLLKESDLEKLPIWRMMRQRLSRVRATLTAEKKKYLIIRSLIDLQVTDLITETERRLKILKPRTVKDVKMASQKTVSFSSTVARLRKPLRALLMDKLYHHYRVVRMSNKAQRFMEELFYLYVSMPKALPDRMQARIARDGVRRVVADYLAGMTDRYALDEYKKLFDPYEKV